MRSSRLTALALGFTASVIACTTDEFSATDAGADSAPVADAAPDAHDVGVPDSSAPDGSASGVVTFRDKGVGSGTATNVLNIAKPVTAVQGDLVIALIAVPDAATVTPPAGFLPVWEDVNTGCISYKAKVFKGVVGAADGPEYAFILSTSGNPAGMVFVYANGVIGKVELAQGSSLTNVASFKVDALATTPGGSVNFAGIISVDPIPQGPQGMTERASISGGRGRGFDLALPDGGAVAERSFGATSPTCASVFQLVLRAF